MIVVLPDKFSIRRLSFCALAALAAAVAVLSAAGCSEYFDSSKLNGVSDYFDSSVTIEGVSYPADTRSVTLTEYRSDDYSDFAKLKNLRTLDVTALDITPDAYQNIRSQLAQDVEIIWSVPMERGKQSSNSSELSFAGGISPSDAHNVRYFTAIRKLSITDAEISDSLFTAITAAQDNNPDVEIFCSAKIYGVSLDSGTELLDLNNIPIESPDLLCKAIELFPGIRTVEMCGCGLSDRVMQGLREEYPQIKFVWTVRFLNYEVRTDIQVFSTLAANLKRPGNSETFAPLFRYCTELRALDLGHMRITDISEIRHLKKLHTLILADNSISDISPLAELKELEFVELFCNRIKDVSPLTELPKLEDVNLCYNSAMKNPAAITGCSSLKRLYISNCSLDAEEIAALKKGVPKDCELNYTAPNAVHSGWRTNKNARSVKIREAFANWRKVKAYPAWNKIIYK